MRILHGITVFIAGAAIATGTALILSACGPGAEQRPADPPPAVAPTTILAEVGARSLTNADVTLTIKVTEKECFGSAGCLITYQVDAATDMQLIQASGHEWEVIYQVDGDEDGPIIGTLLFKPNGTYEQDPVMTASTKNSKVKLKISVTSVGKA